MYSEPLIEELAATAMWLAALIGVAIGTSALQGVLAAAHDAYGDYVLSGARMIASRGIGAAALGIVAVALCPAARAGLVGTRLPLALVALTVSLYLVPLFRPALYAVSSGMVAGGIATLPFAFFAANAAPIPAAWVALVFAGGASCALGGGWLFGAYTGSASIIPSDVLADADGTLARMNSRLQPFVSTTYGWTAVVAAMGALAAFLWAMLVHSQEPPVPQILVAGLVPLGLIFAFDLGRRLLSGVSLFVCRRNVRYYARVDRLSQVFRSATVPVLVLLRYRRTLCDSCLRYSKALESTYLRGRRLCERCGGVITFHGGPGRLVAIVGDQIVPSEVPPRVFVRNARDLVTSARQVDVTHIRLVARGPIAHDLEWLTMFLLNTEPSDGINSVRVWAMDGHDALPQVVHNLVEANYAWADSDPISGV